MHIKHSSLTIPWMRKGEGLSDGARSGRDGEMRDRWLRIRIRKSVTVVMRDV